MGLALEGLIRREYPGDFLQFIEMYSFAKPCAARPISPRLMPKPVTVFDSVVRLRADMSREDVSEYYIPPHFTNIQHALQMGRQFLAAQDTLNRQIILITDGLPTAHFEGPHLFLLYPPDERTEAATMRARDSAASANKSRSIYFCCPVGRSPAKMYSLLIVWPNRPGDACSSRPGVIWIATLCGII